MALPAAFLTSDDYFRSAVEFLKSYAWIFQYSNTCFLKMGVLEHLTSDESEYFINIGTNELNDFPFVQHEISEALPVTLQNFRKRLKELIPKEAFAEPLSIAAHPLSASKKINIKKQHEIHRLAHMIHKLCDEDEVLIDFGAGLGYLSEMLFSKGTNYTILGLEADLERVQTARIRQANIMSSSGESIVYKQHFITEDSAELIEENVKEILRNNGSYAETKAKHSWSIIGLHACADLTVTAIRLFFALPSVRNLIIMPCCYHKLEMLPTLQFHNFPLSRSLQSVVGTFNDEVEYDNAVNGTKVASCGFFNRPFLRLACQQTMSRWHCCSEQEHAEHGSQMWLRAVAEAILDDSVEKVVKRKQKLPTAAADDGLTFSRLCTTFELHSKLTHQSLDWLPHHELKFDDLLRFYPAGAKLAEGLTCLQTAMQKLCENIVLYDRLCYMQEWAESKDLKVSMRFVKLMEEKLSPRCYALIAMKNCDDIFLNENK